MTIHGNSASGRRGGRWLAALMGAGLSLSAFAQASFGHMELNVGMFRIDTEVANTFAARAQGLMHRQLMPEHHGMLFVFPQTAQHCMWMKNTLLPLSVAFLDEQGRILNIADMQPHSEQNHCAARPARYALEMNQGWFARRGVVAGQRIHGIDKAPVAQ